MSLKFGSFVLNELILLLHQSELFVELTLSSHELSLRVLLDVFTVLHLLLELVDHSLGFASLISDALLSFKLSALLLLSELSDVLLTRLLTSRQLSLLDFNNSELGLQALHVFALFVLELLNLALQLLVGLFSKLLLQSDLVADSSQEVVSTLSQSLVAELLADDFAHWAKGTFVQEVLLELTQVSIELVQSTVALVPQLVLNSLVSLVEEDLASLLTALLVLVVKVLELLLHLIFELIRVLILDLTDSSLVKQPHTLGFRFLVQSLQGLVVHGSVVLESS